MSLLGIDVGTSGCKALVFSEEGQLLAAAYEEYDYQHPQPGWAELDTLEVWERIQRTIRKAARGAVHDPVKALCVSSLGESFVPVTANRQILGPSLLNFDGRGAEYLPELRACLSDEHLYRINGNPLGNHYALTKLLWLKRHQPELYQEADWLLHWSGFVSFMLGADPAIDYSLANRTLLFDLEQHDWSDELLELAQFEREKLPPTIATGKVIGAVDRRLAQELGLPANIPIVSGAHDQCCNGVGCGVIEPGRAMYGMGTYICMMPVFDQRPDAAAMIAQGLNTEQHAVPGQYVSFIYNQGGVLVKWFRDTFAAAERKQFVETGADIYAALTAEMPSGVSRVMALPHFTVTGPPKFIDGSCGLIAGLHLETTRGEILKGLIEATTFYLRECFEALPAGIAISDFRAAGGGSKSDAWLQICADILGRPFLRPKVIEAGALGAAIIAGTGSGIFPSIEAGVETMVKWEREFSPNPAMQQRYNERFEKYHRLWPLMQDYLRDMAG
jgi:xylulokinase